MNKWNWKEIFDYLDGKPTKEAATILNNKGILTDEDIAFVAKIVFKEGKEEFIKHMKKNGANSKYEITCVYIPTNGELCAIYDTEVFNRLTAKKYLQENYTGI